MSDIRQVGRPLCRLQSKEDPVRKHSRRVVGVALSSVLVVSGLVSIGVTTAAQASSKGLTWGITSTDPSLDPGLVYAIDPNVVTAAMCNGLLQFGPKGQLEPELASSWKQTS